MALVFFFNSPATTEIYTLSLHDALPISAHAAAGAVGAGLEALLRALAAHDIGARARSEEHTSELQSQSNLVCRLLLEKKNGDQCEPLARQLGEPMDLVRQGVVRVRYGDA